MAEYRSQSEQFLQRRGMWFVLAGAVLWGTTGTTQALAPTLATPLTIGFVRIAIGAITLFLIAAQQGHLHSLRDWRSWPIRATVVASVAIAAYQLFFFAGVARTGVAVGTIVGIGSTPIAAGILTYIVYQSFPGRRWVISTFLALAGCTLLILSGGDLRVNGLGILLAMAAGASYAIYTLLSKELLDIKPRGAVMAVTFGLGAILLVPILAFGDFSWLTEPFGMLVALHLGVITVGVGYTLYAAGLSIISVATTATLTLAEPLTAGLLGIFVLGEKLSPPALVGIVLLLLGLILLVRGPAAAPTSIRNETSI